MSKALTKDKAGGSLILDTWTPEQVELLKKEIAPGLTNDEMKVFAYVCKRRRLDPFLKQIHAVKRNTWNQKTGRYEEVMAIQTGIDGFRAVAARTGLHCGTDDAVFGDTIVDDATNVPESATVTVYKMVGGTRCPFTATAYWHEYAQRKKGGSLNNFWKTKPKGQLAKCAEALALRKAFPDDLSGLYVDEEMHQADNEPPKDDVDRLQEIKDFGAGKTSPRNGEVVEKPDPDRGEESQLPPEEEAARQQAAPEQRQPPKEEKAISAGQVRRFRKLCEEGKYEQELVEWILYGFGYNRVEEIRKSDYEPMCCLAMLQQSTIKEATNTSYSSMTVWQKLEPLTETIKNGKYENLTVPAAAYPVIDRIIKGEPEPDEEPGPESGKDGEFKF